MSGRGLTKRPGWPRPLSGSLCCSVQALFCVGYLRCIRFPTCVEAHWFGFHRIVSGCIAFFFCVAYLPDILEYSILDRISSSVDTCSTPALGAVRAGSCAQVPYRPVTRTFAVSCSLTPLTCSPPIADEESRTWEPRGPRLGSLVARLSGSRGLLQFTG